MRALPLLLVLSVLAGCLGSSAPPDALPAPAATAPLSVAGNATTPAANATLASDLPANLWVAQKWGSAASLVLVDGKQTAHNDASIPPVSDCFLSCSGAFFPPAKDAFVLPGASSVEVTATWTPPPTGVKVTMFYHTAADAPVQQVAVESGKPVTVNVGEKDADAPLSPASLWWFAFFPTADPAGTVPAFDIAAKAVVHRGPTLPTFGAPKDAWNGGTSIALAHDALDVTLCVGCSWGWDGKGPGLVPPGTGKVQVTATWTWAGPTKATVFWYNNVKPSGGLVPMTKDGDTSRTFEMQVPADQLDSPYQLRSGWGFGFFADDGTPLGGPIAAGSIALDVKVLHA